MLGSRLVCGLKNYMAPLPAKLNTLDQTHAPCISPSSVRFISESIDMLKMILQLFEEQSCTIVEHIEDGSLPISLCMQNEDLIGMHWWLTQATCLQCKVSSADLLFNFFSGASRRREYSWKISSLRLKAATVRQDAKASEAIWFALSYRALAWRTSSLCRWCH